MGWPHHPRPIVFTRITGSPLAYGLIFSIFLCLSARIDFIPPDGDSRLTGISISLRLTVIINLSLPHGKNQFHSAYTMIHATRRYQFSLCLTAILNFSLLQRKFFLSPIRAFYKRHFFFPFASFLMLSIKASIHWRWCCFYCDAGWRTAFASFLMLTHLDDGPRFGLGQFN